MIVGKMRSPEIAAQLAKLAAMSDDDIDTDDIPEAPAQLSIKPPASQNSKLPDQIRPRFRLIAILA